MKDLLHYRLEHVFDYSYKGALLRGAYSTEAARTQVEHRDALVLVDVRWLSYEWPSGDPAHYVTNDMSSICHVCANKNFLRTIDPDDEHFYIVAACTHRTEPPQHCDECGKRIDPEDGEDE